MNQVTYANYILDCYWQMIAIDSFIADARIGGWSDWSWCHWLQNYEN